MIKQYTRKQNQNNLIIEGKDTNYFPKLVCVNFAINSLKNESKLKTIGFSSSVPTFNLDQKYFTPAFVLPCLAIKHQQCLEKHQNKIKEYAQISNNQIIKAQPKNKDYCYVCHQKFQSYFEHCESQQHLKRLTGDHYHKKILKMCKKISKFGLHHRNRCQTLKRSKIYTDEEDEYNISSVSEINGLKQSKKIYPNSQPSTKLFQSDAPNRFQPVI